MVRRPGIVIDVLFCLMMPAKSFSNRGEGHTMYPEPTVGAIILNDGNEVLLLRSHKWQGHYVIPGGHIELGEDMEDALRREIKEETNLTVFDIHLLGLQQCIFSDNFHEKKHFIFIDYVCRTQESNVVLNHEHQSYTWVTLEDTEDMPLEPFTRKLIGEYRKGETSSFVKKVLYNYF
jgi:nucleoside triphosphatase